MTRARGPAGRVRSSFERQAVMGLLGARLARVEEGLVEIELPIRAELGQQDGFVHAGVLATIADSAGGYAALTVAGPGMRVLTTEFKLHFLRPARGDRLVARGRVLKPGRTLTVCELAVEAVKGSRRTSVAWGSQTVFNVQDAPPGSSRA